MYEIEFADPIEPTTCPCCGGTIQRFTRFVYKNGDAHAVYYAQHNSSHSHDGVAAVVSLGEWGEGSVEDDRLAFPLVFFLHNGDFAVSLTDADESPWNDTSFLGRMLNREEALVHRWKQEVFDITDQIFEQDGEVCSLVEQMAT